MKWVRAGVVSIEDKKGRGQRKQKSKSLKAQKGASISGGSNRKNKKKVGGPSDERGAIKRGEKSSCVKRFCSLEEGEVKDGNHPKTSTPKKNSPYVGKTKHGSAHKRFPQTWNQLAGEISS